MRRTQIRYADFDTDQLSFPNGTGDAATDFVTPSAELR
jgi:hypothetical protein